MKKRKLNVRNIVIFIIILLIVIITSTKYISYLFSNEYKLKKIGYNESEIVAIEKHLSKDEINKILKLEYSNALKSFVKEKYFIFNNLNRYGEYYKKNKTEKIDEIVTTVNTNTDKDFYEDIKKSDTSKGILTLVNKYHQLDKKYIPKDIVKMSLQYSYENNEIVKEVYDSFVELCNTAKKEMGYVIVATSSYRDYEFQDYLYKKYKSENGERYADSIAARAGHSEHQLGLALDIVSYQKSMQLFKDTEEFLWVRDNAHKYGFILRYPEGKEDITGYSYEPWHYRYVGIDVAKYIYENNITFDEYYTYFIENKNSL